MPSSLPTLTSLLKQTDLEDHEEILRAADRAIKQSTSDLDAQNVKVVALLKLDRFEDAILAFETGGDVLKDRARLEYAYALYKTGKPAEAAGVDSSPRHPWGSRSPTSNWSAPAPGTG